MEKTRAIEPERAKSLNHALSLLNDAADDSASEIRRMVNMDYNKLKRVFTEVKPDVKSALGEIKDLTSESLIHAKDNIVDSTKEAAHKVDESVHTHPWAYLGGVAAVSALAGFLYGRNNKS